jgi:cellobiose phosphorylase
VDYASPAEKQKRLEAYFASVQQRVSGRKVVVSLEEMAGDLREKADWLAGHIRTKEWIRNAEGDGWFNGYYDNDGQRVEGDHPKGIRMTLTGQVFPLMAGVATDEQARELVRSADRYLYDPRVGGYRLNTNFDEVLLNLGRCFGFAYGHKENGAMFSHMAVMYAYALYQRGLVREGHKVLEALYRHVADFAVSKMYPGIPEYVQPDGRGVYTYLTGSASWYLLTLVTQVFGVRGVAGDLVLSPKLRVNQFSAENEASIRTVFAGRRLRIVYQNPEGLDWDVYQIDSIKINGHQALFRREGNAVILERAQIATLDEQLIHTIEALLGSYTE